MAWADQPCKCNGFSVNCEKTVRVLRLEGESGGVDELRSCEPLILPLHARPFIPCVQASRRALSKVSTTTHARTEKSMPSPTILARLRSRPGVTPYRRTHRILRSGRRRGYVADEAPVRAQQLWLEVPLEIDLQVRKQLGVVY